MDLGDGAGHLKVEDPPCQRPVALVTGELDQEQAWGTQQGDVEQAGS